MKNAILGVTFFTLLVAGLPSFLDAQPSVDMCQWPGLEAALCARFLP